MSTDNKNEDLSTTDKIAASIGLLSLIALAVCGYWFIWDDSHPIVLAKVATTAVMSFLISGLYLKFISK